MGSVVLAAIMRFIGTPCRRLLAGDGITSVDFTVNNAHGIFERLSIDARAAKKSAPAIGGTFGIAKNLDEYQYRICSLLPSLADSNPAKVQLQKYRIAIIASFAALVATIKSGASTAEWNIHARALLVESSDLYVAAAAAATSSGQGMQPTRAGDAFSFFGVPEQEVDKAVKQMYGY